MHSVLRPNYRRARALALEIEDARVHLDEARGDPGGLPACLRACQALTDEPGTGAKPQESDVAAIIEDWLDDLDPEIIGPGHVKLEIAPND